VRVSITDNGVGMSEETMRRVFDPFFTTKKIGEGTGPGLATAYGVAKQHDGWIECTAREGAGSTFSVMFPAVDTEVKETSAPRSKRVRGGSETILVVEDEESVRVPVIGVMEGYGYRVLSAADGRAGWDLFDRRRGEVDLVLLDLSLPEISGEELLQRIRERAPETRVIISTGRSDLHEVEDERVLRKPYKVAEALEAIRQMLDDD
jgi:CheY-like chemotaxis protein